MRHHPWRHPIASWTRLLLLCVVLFISWPTDHPSFLVAALDRTSPLPRELHLREMEALRDDDDDEEDGEGGGPTLDHPTDGATFNDYPTLTEVVRQLRWAAQSPTHNPRGDPAYHHFRGVGSRGGPPPHDAKKARREEEEVAATSQHPQPSSAESSPSGGDAPSDLDERNPATDWLREFLFDDAAAVKSNASAALEWAHCFHLVPVFPVEAAMRRLNQQDDDDVFLGLFYAPDIFPIFNYVQWMELLVQLAYTLYALTGRVGRHPATEIDPRSMGTVEELGAKCFPDGLSLPTLLPEQVQLLTDHGVHVGLIDAYYPPQNITHKMLSILHNSISQQPRSGRRREARRGEVRPSSSASSVGWRRRRRRGWWRREAPAEADIDADGSFIMKEEPLRSYHAEARAAELETLQRVLNEVPLSRTHQAALLERLLRGKPEDVDHDDGDDSTTAGATSSQEEETPTAKGATPDEEDEATDDREAHKLLEHLQHAVDLTRRRQHRLAHIIFSHHQAVKYRVHANVSMLRQQGFSSEAVCTSPPPSMWRERPSTAGTTAVGTTGSVADSTKASFTSGEVAPNPRLSSDESQLHSPDNDRGVGEEEEDEDEYLERSASTTHYYRSILRHLRRLRIQEGGGDDRAPAQHARDMMDKENREVARMNFLLGQLTPTMIWPRRQGCRPSFFPQTLLRLRSVHFHGRTQDPPSWNNHTNAEGVFWKAGEGGGKMRQRTYAVLGAEDNPFTRVAALYHNKEDVIEGPLQPAPVVGLLLDEAVSASSPGVLEMRRQRAQVYEERRVEWEMLHPRHNGDVGKLEEELVSGEDAEEDDGGAGRRRREAGPTVATVRDYFFEHDLGIPIDPQRFAETAPLELQLFLRTSTEPLDTFMMVYLQAKMEGLRFALQHFILTEARRFGHAEWWRPQHVGNEPAGQWMEVACARCTHPMENHAGGVDDDDDDDDVAVAWHAIAHRPGVWRNFFGLFTSTPPRPSSPTEFVTAADGEKVAASAVMAVLHQNVSQLQQEPMWPCNCPRVVRRVGVMYLHHNRSAEDYIRVHPLNVQRVAIQRRLHTIQRLARQARLVLLKASEDDYRAQYVDDLMKGMLRQHRIMMEHSVPARDSPTTTP